MDWQPIETAPKDGTYIIIYSKDFGSSLSDTDAAEFTDDPRNAPRPLSLTKHAPTLYVARYYEEHSEMGWFSHSPIYEFLVQPTHWMPLPEPPSVTQD